MFGGLVDLARVWGRVTHCAYECPHKDGGTRVCVALCVCVHVPSLGSQIFF